MIQWYQMSKQFEDLRIGLDIDGVLACFSCGVINRANEIGMKEMFPESCELVDCWDMSDHFSLLMKEAWLNKQFWLGLPPLQAVGFTPICYITSRPIHTTVTEQWLAQHGFPEAEVITVAKPPEKVQHIQERSLDIFIDDLYSTVRELRDVGINALLHEAPYQVGHQAECIGLPTIKSLTKEEILKHV